MGQHGGDIYSEEIQKQIAKEDRFFRKYQSAGHAGRGPAGGDGGS